MPQNIKREDVQLLSNPDEVTSFFLKLGYDTSKRAPSSTKALDITGDLSYAIQHVERIALLDDGFKVHVYLLQLKMHSVTMTAKKALSKAFGKFEGDCLLVLTTNYEQIDFMMIDRSNADAGMTQKELIGTRPPVHRVGGAFPRYMTVNRLNPGTVPLRVLRLFAYTSGQDVFEQSERLRSAYDVLYWSEEYFNNRALFSDYYLKERLPEERSDWKKPDNTESATRRRVQQTLLKLYDGAQDAYGNESAEQIRTQLIESVLALLGFKEVLTKTKKGEERGPDYALFATDTWGRIADPKPLAVCLGYHWLRDLDKQVDESQDPTTFNENPGAVVVALLDKPEAPDWAILTNGKMWRLYAAKAHSRATNYYEIDLEDVVTGTVADREEAFKYFWFLFRRDSFSPTEDGGTRSLLDTLLSGSEQYARRLGDRLKNRIFEDVFHHFAQGFVEYAKKHKLLPEDLSDLDEQQRAQVLKPYFDGTLTFLYRLLFLLYAESRSLLPVREVGSYYQVSLEKLKQDIKQKARDSESDAPANIRRAYDSASTTLYEQLQALFQAIDKGNKDLNVPIYNGGLFMTEPYLLDTSAEAQVSEFLHTHEIPDQYLALGLDLLARDEDDRKSSLVFVDYKSLGVRQLGSIYEGLLEFKLRVATKAMTVVRMEKNKKTEKIIPYEEAKAKGLASVRERREGEMRERIYNLNDVYLENDRSERKATGSYYTPDYIVKYIVQNTVGPVLDQKLEALRPVFEDAEKTRRINQQRNKSLQQQRLAPENAEERTYQHYKDTLNEQFFDLKVLDPAMGSGHFLVEAVDFITDKMTRFLEGFPWNPVVYHLGKIRDEIQSDMEKQEISIEVSKLTNINLLKRQVLKRCIYGVDLNLMAVELAKVSVWLDSFTLGAPLSFLDHHLKCGNSLIGGSIQVVQKALSTQLLGSQFAGLLSAAQLMRLVGERTDSTAREVAQSRQMFKEADADLAPYKRLMNVWVSEYFGSKGAQKTVDRFGQEIINNKYAHIDTIDKEAIEAAQTLAERKHFFHWDLEFPEVFYDKTERKQNEGFDAVVGNPPYGSQMLDEDKLYLSKLYVTVNKRAETYVAFLENAYRYVENEGYISLIIPDTWLTLDFTQVIREMLLRATHILKIVDLPNKVFPEATVDTTVFVVQKQKDDRDRTNSVKSLTKVIRFLPNKVINSLDEGGMVTFYNQLDWTLDTNYKITIDINVSEQKIIKKVRNISSELTKLCSINYGLKAYQEGKGKPPQTRQDVDTKSFSSKGQTDSTYFIFFDGEDIGRYSISIDNKKWLKYGNHLAEPRNLNLFTGERLLYRKIVGKTLIGTVVSDQALSNTLLYIIKPKNALPINAKFLSCLLNSNLFSFFYKKLFRINSQETFPQIMLDDLKVMPIRNITFNTPQAERIDYMKVRGMRLYEEGVSKDNDNTQDILAFVEQHLQAERSDVVHDLLAFLAEEMLCLNREKREEQQRFLAAMVKLLKIRPDKDGKEGIDALAMGKQRIVEYPGEYQKDKPELKLEELVELLYKNKARLGVTSREAIESILQKPYAESLDVVRPLVRQLQYTDMLIDQVVYKLYGLTSEEIDIVEGKR